MTPERWRQVQTVLHAAMAVPATERGTYLVGACAGDAELLREVESLLAHLSQGSGFLSTPAAALSGAMPGRESSLVGRQLGRYTVRERLGSGGMGEVYLAEDTQLRRPVALKALHDDGIITPEGRQRLLREAQAVASLNHPNIAAIYDLIDVTGDAGTPPHIVMEFVAGETLSARLKSGHLPVAEALRVGRDVADALAATHRQGIIHRDLKPANLQITTDGRVKVLDFGLARRIVSGTETTNLTTERAPLSRADLRIAGTPGYMSPEQALGRPVGTPTDVFSLGIVLFEMLAGHRPQPGEEHLPVAPAIDALVARMLAIEPGDRPSAADVLTELDRLLRPDSVADRGPAPPQRRARGFTYEAAAATVVLMLAAGGVTWWWTSSGTIRDHRPSIAILPLVNLTGDSAKDYIGIGIVETLTTSLARVRSVNVISRTGLADLPRGTADLRTIARDVGATLLLQGSVQQSGDRLRVNAKLVSPDGSVSWAGDADALVSDLFTLETRIATAVVAGLPVTVSAEDRQSAVAPPTRNSGALDAYWQGLAFRDRGDPVSLKLAIASLEKATSLDPQSAAAFGALGDTYRLEYVAVRDKAWLDKATAAIERGLVLDPTRTEVQMSLAMLYSQTGRAPAAVDELRRVIAQNPNNDEAHRRLAAALNEIPRPQEALAEYQAAVILRPEYWRNQQVLGLFFYGQGRMQDAVSAFTRVIEIRPDDANAYLQRGSAFQSMGDTARARADYERSNKLEPNAAAYSNLGTLAYIQSRYAEAAQAFAAAIKMRPTRAVYHRNLGDAYIKLTRAADARVEYLQAITLAQNVLAVNPNDVTSLSQLAVYEAKVGRSREARQHADEAVAHNPSSPEVLFRRAVVLTLIGDTTAAIAALKDAVDHGYSIELVRTEDDLARLANVREFRQLITKTADSQKGVGR
jgi:serine/threonine-protein kinase